MFSLGAPNNVAYYFVFIKKPVYRHISQLSLRKTPLELPLSVRVGVMSVFREANKGSKEKHGSTPDVCLTEVSML